MKMSKPAPAKKPMQMVKKKPMAMPMTKPMPMMKSGGKKY
jgi:hypothetical protein